MKNIITLALIFIFSLSSYTDEDVKNFLFYKEIIIPDENKYNYFFLDNEVYRYSKNDLSDLRIINKDKIFIPFYIIKGSGKINREESTFKTKKIYNLSMKKENADYFDFQIIPPDKKITSRKLLLNTSSSDFSKRVKVYGRYLSGDWEFIQDDTIYNFDKYKKLQIELAGEPDYGFYRIAILDNPEKISIESLDIIHLKEETSFEIYKQNAQIKYEVKENNKETIIAIDNSDKLNIMKLYLSANGNFKRNYVIYDDEKMDNEILKSEIYQFDFKNTRVSKIDIDFSSPVNAARLWIKIENSDDKPLAIKKINADFITDKIVFEDDKTGPYLLLFGNESVQTPSYDIKTYIEYIEKEKQGKCELKKINVKNFKVLKKNNEFNFKLIFNISIILISILLIAIIALTLFKSIKK